MSPPPDRQCTLKLKKNPPIYFTWLLPLYYNASLSNHTNIQKNNFCITVILEASKGNKTSELYKMFWKYLLQLRPYKEQIFLPGHKNQLKTVEKQKGECPFSVGALPSRCQTGPGSLWKAGAQPLPLVLWWRRSAGRMVDMGSVSFPLCTPHHHRCSISGKIGKN